MRTGGFTCVVFQAFLRRERGEGLKIRDFQILCRCSAAAAAAG